MEWVKDLTKDTNLKQICIDGKILRRSYDKTISNFAIHMVNARSTSVGLSLGQLRAQEKLTN